jgi:hypothetical protein
MTVHCANLVCNHEFDAADGEFYALEARPGYDGDAEYLWLCPECAPAFRNELGRSGVVPVELSEAEQLVLA